MNQTRGVRNNNPGNIDYNPANKWQGQLPPNPALEKRFVRFDSPENGIRALGKLLQTYQNKHCLDTVRKIINRWAPPVENDSGAYVRAVATKIGVLPDQTITLKDPRTLSLLVQAIIHHENAGFSYPDSVIAEGIRRALT